MAANINVKTITTTIPWETATGDLEDSYFRCVIYTTYFGFFLPYLLISYSIRWFLSSSENPSFVAVKSRENNWSSKLLKVLPTYADAQC